MMNIRTDKSVLLALMLMLCMAIPVSAEDNASQSASAVLGSGAEIAAELNDGKEAACGSGQGDSGSKKGEASEVTEEVDEDGTEDAGDEDQTETGTPEEGVSGSDTEGEEEPEAASADDEEEDGFALEYSGIRYYVTGKGSINISKGKLTYKPGAGYHLESVFTAIRHEDNAEDADGALDLNEEEINIDVLTANEFVPGSRVTLYFEPDETDRCRADNSSSAIYDGVLEGGGSDDM